MQNEMQVKNITFEPSSADAIASTIKFDASVNNMQIGEIGGTTKLNGTLTNGKLHLEFSIHFDWGWGKKKTADDNSSLEEFKRKLKVAGLNDEQIGTVIKLIEEELNNMECKPGTAEYLEESKKGIIGGNEYIIEEVKGGNDLPLPDVPLNLDVELDVKNVTVDAVTLNTDSAITVDNFKTSETTVSDIDVVSEISLPFKRMELDEMSTPPLNVLSLDIPDVSTAFTISDVHSSEIPITMKTESGSADINLKKLVDWHPRWKFNFGFQFFWWYLGIWVEFGLNLRIDVFFKLLIKFLEIAITMKNVILNGLNFTLKLLKTSIVNAKLGALKIGKIIGKMLGKS